MVDKFTYLGSTLSRVGHIDDEVNARIAKANAAFDQQLQVVDKFTFLGSTLPRVVHIDDEVNARIDKANAAFGQLHGSIWDRSGIRLDTKLEVYRSVVLPTLLYACESDMPKE